MQLFYTPNIDETTETFSFDKVENKHIIKVLRKKDTDVLFVTNGEATYSKQKLLCSDSKCGKNSFFRKPRSKYHLHIAVAPTK
jgi:16S rRNA (uracil1498-N3)-methyltransferase